MGIEKERESRKKELQTDDINEERNIRTIEGHFYHRAWLASISLNWEHEIRKEAVERYSREYTEFWRKHKLIDEYIKQNTDTNDYTLNLMEGMDAILGIILDDESYLEGENFDEFSRLSKLYLGGAEAHDVDRWKIIPPVMKEYYEMIISEQKT